MEGQAGVTAHEPKGWLRLLRCSVTLCPARVATLLLPTCAPSSRRVFDPIIIIIIIIDKSSRSEGLPGCVPTPERTPDLLSSVQHPNSLAMLPMSDMPAFTPVCLPALRFPRAVQPRTPTGASRSGHGYPRRRDRLPGGAAARPWRLAPAPLYARPPQACRRTQPQRPGPTLSSCCASPPTLSGLSLSCTGRTTQDSLSPPHA